MVYIIIGVSVFTVFMLVKKMLREDEKEQRSLEIFNRRMGRK
jgi:uncharacterized membrane protein YuzA (DUF378 family)